MDATLADLGWDERWAAALPAGLSPARVACGHQDLWTLLGAGPPRLAALGGRLRHEATTPAELPAVGDWVGVDAAGTVIRALLPRRSALSRGDARTGQELVLAANVDVVLVVTSANRDLNARRIERFAALAVAGGTECVAVLNKSDLMTDVGDAVAAVRAAVGDAIPIVVTSAQAGEGLDELRTWVRPGRTIALLGTSGVGKSTLANVLLGTDVQVTAPIRAVDDRGRHTTVRRELFVLPGGGLLVDTPGLKLPRMVADADGGMDATFDDLEGLAEACRFRDCTHDGEPGCAVAEAIADGRLDPARLEARRQLEREERWARERSDPAGRSDRKARSRAVHAEHRRTPPRWEQ